MTSGKWAVQKNSLSAATERGPVTNGPENAPEFILGDHSRKMVRTPQCEA